MIARETMAPFRCYPTGVPSQVPSDDQQKRRYLSEYAQRIPLFSKLPDATYEHESSRWMVSVNGEMPLPQQRMRVTDAETGVAWAPYCSLFPSPTDIECDGDTLTWTGVGARGSAQLDLNTMALSVPQIDEGVTVDAAAHVHCGGSVGGIASTNVRYMDVRIRGSLDMKLKAGSRKFTGYRLQVSLPALAPFDSHSQSWPYQTMLSKPFKGGDTIDHVFRMPVPVACPMQQSIRVGVIGRTAWDDNGIVPELDFELGAFPPLLLSDIKSYSTVKLANVGLVNPTWSHENDVCRINVGVSCSNFPTDIVLQEPDSSMIMGSPAADLFLSCAERCSIKDRPSHMQLKRLAAAENNFFSSQTPFCSEIKGIYAAFFGLNKAQDIYMPSCVHTTMMPSGHDAAHVEALLGTVAYGMGLTAEKLKENPMGSHALRWFCEAAAFVPTLVPYSLDKSIGGQGDDQFSTCVGCGSNSTADCEDMGRLGYEMVRAIRNMPEEARSMPFMSVASHIANTYTPYVATLGVYGTHVGSGGNPDSMLGHMACVLRAPEGENKPNLFIEGTGRLCPFQQPTAMTAAACGEDSLQGIHARPWLTSMALQRVAMNLAPSMIIKEGAKKTGVFSAMRVSQPASTKFKDGLGEKEMQELVAKATGEEWRGTYNFCQTINSLQTGTYVDDIAISGRGGSGTKAPVQFSVHEKGSTKMGMPLSRFMMKPESVEVSPFLSLSKEEARICAEAGAVLRTIRPFVGSTNDFIASDDQDMDTIEGAIANLADDDHDKVTYLAVQKRFFKGDVQDSTAIYNAFSKACVAAGFSHPSVGKVTVSPLPLVTGTAMSVLPFVMLPVRISVEAAAAPMGSMMDTRITLPFPKDTIIDNPIDLVTRVCAMVGNSDVMVPAFFSYLYNLEGDPRPLGEKIRAYYTEQRPLFECEESVRNGVTRCALEWELLDLWRSYMGEDIDDDEDKLKLLLWDSPNSLFQETRIACGLGVKVYEDWQNCRPNQRVYYEKAMDNGNSWVSYDAEFTSYDQDANTITLGTVVIDLASPSYRNVYYYECSPVDAGTVALLDNALELGQQIVRFLESNEQHRIMISTTGTWGNFEDIQTYHIFGFHANALARNQHETVTGQAGFARHVPLSNWFMNTVTNRDVLIWTFDKECVADGLVTPEPLDKQIFKDMTSTSNKEGASSLPPLYTINNPAIVPPEVDDMDDDEDDDEEHEEALYPSLPNFLVDYSAERNKCNILAFKFNQIWSGDVACKMEKYPAINWPYDRAWPSIGPEIGVLQDIPNTDPPSNQWQNAPNAIQTNTTHLIRNLPEAKEPFFEHDMFSCIGRYGDSIVLGVKNGWGPEWNGMRPAFIELQDTVYDENDDDGNEPIQEGYTYKSTAPGLSYPNAATNHHNVLQIYKIDDDTVVAMCGNNWPDNSNRLVTWKRHDGGWVEQENDDVPTTGYLPVQQIAVLGGDSKIFLYISTAQDIYQVKIEQDGSFDWQPNRFAWKKFKHPSQDDPELNSTGFKHSNSTQYLVVKRTFYIEGNEFALPIDEDGYGGEDVKEHIKSSVMTMYKKNLDTLEELGSFEVTSSTFTFVDDDGNDSGEGYYGQLEDGFSYRHSLVLMSLDNDGRCFLRICIRGHSDDDIRDQYQTYMWNGLTNVHWGNSIDDFELQAFPGCQPYRPDDGAFGMGFFANDMKLFCKSWGIENPDRMPPWIHDYDYRKTWGVDRIIPLSDKKYLQISQNGLTGDCALTASTFNDYPLATTTFDAFTTSKNGDGENVDGPAIFYKLNKGYEPAGDEPEEDEPEEDGDEPEDVAWDEESRFDGVRNFERAEEPAEPAEPEPANSAGNTEGVMTRSQKRQRDNASVNDQAKRGRSGTRIVVREVPFTGATVVEDLAALAAAGVKSLWKKGKKGAKKLMDKRKQKKEKKKMKASSIGAVVKVPIADDEILPSIDGNKKIFMSIEYINDNVNIPPFFTYLFKRRNRAASLADHIRSYYKTHKVIVGSQVSDGETPVEAMLLANWKGEDDATPDVKLTAMMWGDGGVHNDESLYRQAYVHFGMVEKSSQMDKCKVGTRVTYYRTEDQGAHWQELKGFLISYDQSTRTLTLTNPIGWGREVVVTLPNPNYKDFYYYEYLDVTEETCKALDDELQVNKQLARFLQQDASNRIMISTDGEWGVNDSKAVRIMGFDLDHIHASQPMAVNVAYMQHAGGIRLSERFIDNCRSGDVLIWAYDSTCKNMVLKTHDPKPLTAELFKKITDASPYLPPIWAVNRPMPEYDNDYTVTVRNYGFMWMYYFGRNETRHPNAHVIQHGGTDRVEIVVSQSSDFTRTHIHRWDQGAGRFETGKLRIEDSEYEGPELLPIPEAGNWAEILANGTDKTYLTIAEGQRAKNQAGMWDVVGRFFDIDYKDEGESFKVTSDGKKLVLWQRDGGFQFYIFAMRTAEPEDDDSEEDEPADDQPVERGLWEFDGYIDIPHGEAATLSNNGNAATFGQEQDPKVGIVGDFVVVLFQTGLIRFWRRKDRNNWVRCYDSPPSPNNPESPGTKIVDFIAAVDSNGDRRLVLLYDLTSQPGKIDDSKTEIKSFKSTRYDHIVDFDNGILHDEFRNVGVGYYGSKVCLLNSRSRRDKPGSYLTQYPGGFGVMYYTENERPREEGDDYDDEYWRDEPRGDDDELMPVHITEYFFKVYRYDGTQKQLCIKVEDTIFRDVDIDVYCMTHEGGIIFGLQHSDEPREGLASMKFNRVLKWDGAEDYTIQPEFDHDGGFFDFYTGLDVVLGGEEPILEGDYRGDQFTYKGVTVSLFPKDWEDDLGNGYANSPHQIIREGDHNYDLFGIYPFVKGGKNYYLVEGIDWSRPSMSRFGGEGHRQVMLVLDSNFKTIEDDDDDEADDDGDEAEFDRDGGFQKILDFNPPSDSAAESAGAAGTVETRAQKRQRNSDSQNDQAKRGRSGAQFFIREISLQRKMGGLLSTLKKFAKASKKKEKEMKKKLKKGKKMDGILDTLKGVVKEGKEKAEKEAKRLKEEFDTFKNDAKKKVKEEAEKLKQQMGEFSSVVRKTEFHIMLEELQEAHDRWDDPDLQQDLTMLWTLYINPVMRNDDESLQVAHFGRVPQLVKRDVLSHDEEWIMNVANKFDGAGYSVTFLDWIVNSVNGGIYEAQSDDDEEEEGYSSNDHGRIPMDRTVRPMPSRRNVSRIRMPSEHNDRLTQALWNVMIAMRRYEPTAGGQVMREKMLRLGQAIHGQVAFLFMYDGSAEEIAEGQARMTRIVNKFKQTMERLEPTFQSGISKRTMNTLFETLLNRNPPQNVRRLIYDIRSGNAWEALDYFSNRSESRHRQEGGVEDAFESMTLGSELVELMQAPAAATVLPMGVFADIPSSYDQDEMRQPVYPGDPARRIRHYLRKFDFEVEGRAPKQWSFTNPMQPQSEYDDDAIIIVDKWIMSNSRFGMTSDQAVPYRVSSSKIFSLFWYVLSPSEPDENDVRPNPHMIPKRMGIKHRSMDLAEVLRTTMSWSSNPSENQYFTLPETLDIEVDASWAWNFFMSVTRTSRMYAMVQEPVQLWFTSLVIRKNEKKSAGEGAGWKELNETSSGYDSDTDVMVATMPAPLTPSKVMELKGTFDLYKMLNPATRKRWITLFDRQEYKDRLAPDSVAIQWSSLPMIMADRALMGIRVSRPRPVRPSRRKVIITKGVSKPKSKTTKSTTSYPKDFDKPLPIEPFPAEFIRQHQDVANVFFMVCWYMPTPESYMELRKEDLGDLRNKMLDLGQGTFRVLSNEVYRHIAPHEDDPSPSLDTHKMWFFQALDMWHERFLGTLSEYLLDESDGIGKQTIYKFLEPVYPYPDTLTAMQCVEYGYSVKELKGYIQYKLVKLTQNAAFSRVYTNLEAVFSKMVAVDEKLEDVFKPGNLESLYNQQEM